MIVSDAFIAAAVSELRSKAQCDRCHQRQANCYEPHLSGNLVDVALLRCVGFMPTATLRG